MDLFDFSNLDNTQSISFNLPQDTSDHIQQNNYYQSSIQPQLNSNQTKLEIVFQLNTNSNQHTGEQEFYNINDLVDRINQQKPPIINQIPSKHAIKSQKYREKKKQQELQILNQNEQLYQNIISQYQNNMKKQENEIDQVIQEYQNFKLIYLGKVKRNKKSINTSQLKQKEISRQQRQREKTKAISLKILNENLKKIYQQYFQKQENSQIQQNFQKLSQENDKNNISDIKNVLNLIKQQDSESQHQVIHKQQQMDFEEQSDQNLYGDQYQNFSRQQSSQNNFQFQSVSYSDDFNEQPDISFLNTA